MNYGPGWRPPWRHTEQARCKGPNCTQKGVPGALVMACTLDAQGWCTACSRTADDSHTELRLGL